MSKLKIKSFISLLTLFSTLFFLSIYSYAGIVISPTQSSISSDYACNDPTVESYVSNIISRGSVTAEETSTGTAQFKFRYPANANHTSLKGRAYIYSGSTKIATGSLRTLRSYASYSSVYKTNIPDGTYFIRWDLVLASDSSKGCVLKSNNFTISTAPAINSISVSPASAYSGSTFTFTANLSGSLPSGYSMKIDIGAGFSSMDRSSSTVYRYSRTANSVGNNRTYTVNLVNSSGSTVSTRSGTYTVTTPPETQYPPSLSITSASSNVTQGDSYCIALRGYDSNSNLKNIFVNWGDSSSNSSYSYVSNTDAYTRKFCHTYGEVGSFTWSSTVYDHTGKTDFVSKTVTVNAPPNTPPIVKNISFSQNSNDSVTVTYTLDDLENKTMGTDIYISNANDTGSGGSYQFISKKTVSSKLDGTYSVTWSAGELLNLMASDSTYSVRLNVFDLGGLEAIGYSSSITYTLPNLPVAISAVNLVQNANESLTVSFSLNDPENNTMGIDAYISEPNATGSNGVYQFASKKTLTNRTDGTYAITWTASELSSLATSGSNYSVRLNVFDIKSLEAVSYSTAINYFSNEPLPISISKPTAVESNDPSKIFTFSTTLSEELPDGYGVFLSFDDQQGGWFSQDMEGGHFQLIHQGNNVYSVDYTLVKPGLRSFRAGIFYLGGDNDVLVGAHSEKAICTLSDCLAAVNRPNSYGNPAFKGNGSQLFKNVDVATGNYHLSTTDIAVPGKGPSFAFTRAYNSMAEAGKQWSFAYEAKATFLTGTFNREVAVGPREDGHFQYFFKDMDDSWYALDAGNFDKLMEVNGELVLYTQGNKIYRFTLPTSSSNGILKGIQDRLGNVLSFNHSGDNLIGITDANGRNHTVSRDSNNRIQRVTDSTNRYVEYTYDTSGMITLVRNVRGGYHKYSYMSSIGNDRYRIKTITDPRDNVQVTLDYGSYSFHDESVTRVKSITDAYNNITRFAYSNDVQGTGVNQPEVDNQNHNLVFVFEDNRTRIIDRVDAKGFGDYKTTKNYKAITSRTELPEQSLPVELTDQNNNSTTIIYSDEYKGRPTNVKDAQGRESEATYANINGQENFETVTTLKSPGVDKLLIFEDHTVTGKPRKVIDQRDNIITNMYDNNDWLIRRTDARGFTTLFGYDAIGNVIQETDPFNNKTTRTYDSLSRLKTETSPLGLITSFTYDERGNIASRNYSAEGINYTKRYSYDASNNMIQMIDPKGVETNYTYDKLNQKIGVSYTVNDVLHTREYIYDAMRRLRTVINERTQSSTTHYDSRSQLKSQVNELGKTTVTYTYDKNGNVTTVVDADGRAVTTSYDKINRKIKAVDDEGNEESWTYNPAGQVATATDKRKKVTSYLYDDTGNVIQVNDPNSGITKITYDANGNVLAVVDPKGNKTTYTYDAFNRRLSTTLNNGQIRRFTYDAAGNVLTEIPPTGESIVRVYDALSRMTSQSEYNASSELTRQMTYEYDENNNIISKVDELSGNRIAYTYDVLNRIISVTDQYGQTLAYGYDKAGNRTSLTYPGDKTAVYGFDDADRLLSVTDWLGNKTAYNRNDSGQLIQTINGNGTKARYIYDESGRLTLLENLKADNAVISRHQLTLDKSGNITQSFEDLPIEPALPPSITNMSYDDNNRIIAADTKTFSHDESGRITEQDTSGDKKVYHFNVNDLITSITHNGSATSRYRYDLNDNRISQTQGNVETRYVIDQLAALPNVVAETDDTGVVTHYYVYGEGLISKIDASNNGHFYHFDNTGHTVALTDDNGEVTDKYAYAPYGYTTVEGNTHNPFRYVGKFGVMDDGNGLHYMRARYYKEGIKRFMSLDALHGKALTPQSLNRYAYVLGNPISGIDPSGLICEYASNCYKRLEAVELYAKIFVETSVDLAIHIKDDAVELGENAIEVGTVAGRVAKDAAHVYIYQPARDTVDTCRSNNLGTDSAFLNGAYCVGTAVENVAGGGLDAINPYTAAKVALREPIRQIAQGDSELERELIEVSDIVLDLVSIRKSFKTLTHSKNRIEGAKKAIKTIKDKVNDNRGLAANQSNLKHHIDRYFNELYSVISAAESWLYSLN